jgi:hypothetical protein
LAPRALVLAQQGLVPGPAGAPGGAPFGVPAGGPFVFGGQGFVQPIDYGPELVELIQRTISPDTWDVNGGNGTVFYYAPLRVLVVRAPAAVHGQVGGVLGQARVGR